MPDNPEVLLKRHFRASAAYDETTQRLLDYLDKLEARSQSGDVGLLESIAIKTIIQELEEIFNVEK